MHSICRLSWAVAMTMALALAGCTDQRAGKGGGSSGPGGRGGELTTVLAVAGTKGSGITLQSGDGEQALRVGQAITVGSTVRTKEGVRARVKLVDGTQLHFNEATEISLEGQRQLKIARGELFAEVATVVGQALRIDTPAGQVLVSGTKLNVKVEAEQTTVDVTRGTVEVEGGGSRVEVGAGERATVKRGEAPRVGLSRDLAYITSWAREVDVPPPSPQALQRGFGSLTARVPGRGKSRALRLASHQVRVVIQDNIARTEIEQSYYNASGETLEGTYRFPLPPGASISRLALYVGNRLEEGEIVERRRARAIFRKIVEDSIRPRDPALLEWVGGRTFQMKIFPIPPRSARRVILAYTQALPASYGRYQYVYPMSSRKGQATRIGQFGVDLRVAHSRGLGRVEAPLYPVISEKADDGGTRLRYEASDFVPAASFVVNYAAAGPAPELQLALFEPEAGQRAGRCALRRRDTARTMAAPHGPHPMVCGDRGGFFMAVLRPELPRTREATARDLLFVLDSSYGTGKRGWQTQQRAVQAFLAEMDLRSRFNILACDARCQKMGDGFVKPTAETRKAALSFVSGISPGGSSDLQGAFAEAGRVAAAGKNVRVIYLGDGRPTAGELREPELARLAVGELRRAGATLSALQLGEDVGEQFLTEATRRLGGSVHPLDPGDDIASRVFEVVAAQYRPTLSDLEVSFEGVDAHSVYPRRLPSISAGSETVIVGRYGRGGKGALLVRGQVEGRPFERRYPIALRAEGEERRANNFVPRLWALHQIDALSVDDYDGNRPEIVRLSQAYTVMSKATAFLVLENERMYREFRVKRKRGRDYWDGSKIAVRGGRDEAKKTEAQTSTGAKLGVGDLASATRSTAGAGRAKGAESAGPSLAPAEQAPAGEPMMDDAADEDEVLALREAEEAAPDAAPTAPAMKAPSMAPKAKRAPMQTSSAIRKARRRPSRPPMSKPYPRDYRPRPHYAMRWVRRAQIQPLLSVQPGPAAERQEQRLRQRVQADPLRRSARRAYQRALVRNGRYDKALEHAIEWTELEGQRAEALRALADMQAALHGGRRAMRSYASMVEVQPFSARLHQILAQMYHNKGELRRSCAHRWSLVSLTPRRFDRQAELARCLARAGERDTALRVLAEAGGSLSARDVQRLQRVIAEVQGGLPPASQRARGPLQVTATWSEPVDLDLVLITPRGERISALYPGRSGSVSDSHDGRTAEVLAVRWVPNGRYRVEIAQSSGSEAPKTPVTGTVLIKAHGKSQVVPFVLGDHERPIAQLTLRRERVRYRVR